MIANVRDIAVDCYRPKMAGAYDAYVDGECIADCFHVDEDRGEAWVYARDENGTLQIERFFGETRLRIRGVRGRVELRKKEEG